MKKFIFPKTNLFISSETNLFISDFVLIASTLIFITSVGLFLTKQKTKLPDSKSQFREIYTDNLGYPLYSLGACLDDSDCVPAGCSEQICSNDPDLFTTCEVRDDFPDKDIYACGCVNAHCVWYSE